jgi:hypothetical protein
LPEDSTNQPEIDLTTRRKALGWSGQPLTRWQIFAAWIFVAILQGPYLLYTKGSLPLRADHRVFEGEIGPEYPQHRVGAVFGPGFRYAGHWCKSPGEEMLPSICDVYPPGEPGFGATGADRVGPEHNSPAGFKARFDDSFAFESSNSYVALIVRPDSRFPVFRFPAVRSILDLYRLHRKIKELFALSHRPLSQMKPANC